MENIIVGLDIGTNRVRAVMGFLNENNLVEIVGVGEVPSRGLKNGIIINIDNTIAAISAAVDEAELMAGREAGGVVVGITGQHVKGQNSRGVVAITSRNRSISSQEVLRVIDAARAVVIPVDREILHVLSKEFTVDDQTGIKDPIGMSGVRLEAEVHIITGAKTSLQNVVKSVEKAGFQYIDVVFNPIAAADAVVAEDEKELGVAFVDIGGGTVDIVVYLEGGVSHTAVLSVGGANVTSDISIGLRTPIDSAELIKRKYGCSVIEMVDASETVEVPSVGGRAPRRLFRQELTQIIEPRMVEIMEMIDQELIKSEKKDMLAAGVVITGGGSLLRGTLECAERVLNLPVRIGVPSDIAGLKDVVASPEFSNGVGLLKYGIKMNRFRTKPGVSHNRANVFARLRKWIEEYL